MAELQKSVCFSAPYSFKFTVSTQGMAIDAGLSGWGRVLRIHRADAPQVDLDRATLLLDYLDSSQQGQLVIVRSQLGVWLETYPNTGKLLKAMQEFAFHPNSKSFNVNWSVKTVDEVPPIMTCKLLKEAFPATDEAYVRFVRVLARLTAYMEEWNMINLRFLQNWDPGMKCLRHVLCEHWMELARSAATEMVPERPDPIFLLRSHESGRGVAGIVPLGHSFPAAFERNLRVLPFPNATPSLEVGDGAAALLSLDVDWSKETQSDEVLSAFRRIRADPPAIEGNEVLRLVHIQLRLSSMGLAEVLGELDQTHAHFLAELLRYSFYVMKDGQGLHEKVKTATAEFKPDENRGLLLLVLGLQAWERAEHFASLIEDAKPVPLRLILCYEEPQTVDGSSTMAACAWWPERRCKSPKKGGAGYDSGDSPQSP